MSYKSKSLFLPSRLSVHLFVHSFVTLQRYIMLLAPEAPSVLSQALPNLECIRAADNFLVNTTLQVKRLIYSSRKYFSIENSYHVSHNSKKIDTCQYCIQTCTVTLKWFSRLIYITLKIASSLMWLWLKLVQITFLRQVQFIKAELDIWVLCNQGCW